MKILKLLLDYSINVIFKNSFFILKFSILNKKFFFLGFYILFKFLFFMVSQNIFLKKKYSFTRSMYIKFMKEHLQYSDDWFSNNIHTWCHIFKKNKLKSNKLKILEIGSYEGISACFFLKYLQDSKIDCVETFEGSDEHFNKDFNKIYLNFNFNLSRFENRYKLFKMKSNIFFDKLENDHDNREKYDLIYIDGSHKYEDVLSDAIRSFKNLKDGGIIIFDDFLRNYYDDIKKNTIMAVMEFLNSNNNVKILLVNYQIVIKKIGN